MTYVQQPGLFELQPTFLVHYSSYKQALFSLWLGDVLASLRAMPANSVHVVFFSPPYWMIKDYGHPDQWGQEPTLAGHIDNILALFAELRRVLHPTGTVWMNYQDVCSQNGKKTTPEEMEGFIRRQAEYEYQTSQFGKRQWQRAAGTAKASGIKAKNMLQIPQRLSLAIQDTGWFLRGEIIWEKPNCNSEGVRDRPSRSHEMIYMFSRKPQYFYDIHAVRNRQRVEGDGWVHGTQLRSVWKIPAAPSKSGHPATFPLELPRRGVLLGSSHLGCCPECLHPVRPLYEPGEPDLRAQRACGGNSAGEYHGKGKRDYSATNSQDPSDVKRRRLKSLRPWRLCGARATCRCLRSADDAIPCTVLDPFSGEGTTGRAALMNGRAYVGIEIVEKHAQYQVDHVAPLAGLLERLR